MNLIQIVACPHPVLSYAKGSKGRDSIVLHLVQYGAVDDGLGAYNGKNLPIVHFRRCSASFYDATKMMQRGSICCIDNIRAGKGHQPSGFA